MKFGFGASAPIPFSPSGIPCSVSASVCSPWNAAALLRMPAFLALPLYGSLVITVLNPRWNWVLLVPERLPCWQYHSSPQDCAGDILWMKSLSESLCDGWRSPWASVPSTVIRYQNKTGTILHCGVVKRTQTMTSRRPRFEVSPTRSCYGCYCATSFEFQFTAMQWEQYHLSRKHCCQG